MMTKQNPTALLLRLALATVFLYAAIASHVSPKEWIGYFPTMLTDHVSSTLLLRLFSVYELFLAAWLLTGFYVRYAALLAAATLFGIVVSNFHLFIISFRDIGLMLAAVALATMPENCPPKTKAKS